MPRALVFGGSGQLGDGLLPLLRAAGYEVLAVSRQARAPGDGLRWWVGALDGALARPSGDFDVVFSLGPLDAFARWQARVGPVAARVIAFGSTSVATKAAAIDAGERDLAARLRDAEEDLFTSADRHGFAATVLRPTLIYGRGRDRTLTRIAAFAQRRGFFVLPRGATGRRQPVHVDDLAAAAVTLAQAPALTSRAYDLPGGETIAFDAMVQRLLDCLPRRPRLRRLPMPLFRLALLAARGVGAADGIESGMLERLQVDQVFDAGDARRDFGYAPRPFAPTPAMFGVGGVEP